MSEVVRELFERRPRPQSLDLELQVRDPEVIEELLGHLDGRDRQEFALAALRMGVLAFRQARGQLDAQTVRGEVGRLLDELERGLAQHRTTLHERLEQTLREYFDPQSGRFAERVDRLTREDGELATVLRREVSGDGSELVRSLGQHLGPESPLLRLMDPANAEGLLAGLSSLVNGELERQRERILGEFSLDNRQGSLTRLLAELRESHGELTGELGERIEEVMREFSLEDEDTALSRLVERVERAQQQITNEFSLDSETSALARLRRELMGVAEVQGERIARMERRVAAEMAALAARRAEIDRTTLHGDEFEDAVAAQLAQAASQLGDVFERTGTRVGQIKSCKKGDAVIRLGPDCEAAGARIVFEAKEDKSFNVPRALEELEVARKNRAAELGVFVFSRRTAPEQLGSMTRVGSDLLVVWDREDAASDVLLHAALSVCRALALRGARLASDQVDFEALDRAIRDVEKQAAGLDEIKRSAQTIESGAERILERVRKMSRNLAQAVEALDRGSESARRALSD